MYNNLIFTFDEIYALSIDLPVNTIEAIAKINIIQSIHNTLFKKSKAS